MQATDPRLARAKSLIAAKQFEEGRNLLRILIEDGIETDNCHLNYGVSLIQEGRAQEAIEYLEGCGSQAPEIQINIAAAAGGLGDEQRECQALVALLKTRQQVHAQPYQKLRAWARKNKRWDVAYEALHLLFEMDSEDFGICFELGEVCREMRRHKQAVTFLLKAQELTEDENQITAIHGMLAGLYKDCGEQQKALRYFRSSYERNPCTDTCSNLIMDMQYTHGVTLKDFYRQCKEFSARFLRYLPRFQHDPARMEPARALSGLRIGWMSGDFKTHSLTSLMLPQFKEFGNRGPHQHFLYSSIPEADETDHSREFQACGTWRRLHGLPNEQAAQAIYDDQIDVLVDLAGHTGYNRLPVFGYKPAPVQAGWISGMMTPPALETINYFITDPHIRPDCADEVCDEQLLEIDSTCSYFPIAEAPDVGPLPADRKGHVTFGSFNNPCKISREVVIGWANVLRNVPGSRMLIKVYTQGTESMIRRLMLGLGITEDRLQFVRHLPRTEDVMTVLTQEVDVFLDTWPCAGMLTSAESLWMGVPVITMVGETFLHRQTWTLLCQIGKREWAGTDLQSFIKAAIDLATDRQLLRTARQELRGLMEAAPLRKPEQLADQILRRLEDAWVDWCESRQSLWALTA